MTSDRVPYLTYGQRLWFMGAMFAWMAAATIAARVLLGPDPVFLFAALGLALLSAALVANWWAVRSGCELVSPDERQRRLTADAASEPLWRGALWRGVLFGAFIPVIQVLFRADGRLDWRDEVWVLGAVVAITFPLMLALGFVLTNFARRAARERLAAGSSDDAPVDTPLWRANQVRTYFLTLAVAFAVAGLAALAVRLLFKHSVAGAFGFFLGFCAGLTLALWLTGQLRRQATRIVRADRFSLARAAFVGLWVGVPIGLVTAAMISIAYPETAPGEIAQTFFTFFAGAMVFAAFMWAIVQARDWTPRQE